MNTTTNHSFVWYLFQSVLEILSVRIFTVHETPCITRHFAKKSKLVPIKFITLITLALPGLLTAQEIRGIYVPGDSLLLKSCAINPINHDIYTGSVHDGAIYRLRSGNTITFLAGHSHKMTAAAGIAVDALQNRLWVCNMDLANPVTGTSSIKVFSLANKKLLKSFDIPNDGMPHAPIDIALDINGSAYITDQFSSVVWKAEANLSNLEVFINPSQFPSEVKLNAISMTPDHRYFIVTASGKANDSIYRISFTNKEISKVNISAFSGGDGIVFIKPEILVATTINDGLEKITFTNNFTDATVEKINNSAILKVIDNAPSSVRYSNEKLYVVNSQLNRVVRTSPHHGKPFDPFTISVIPVSMIK